MRLIKKLRRMASINVAFLFSLLMPFTLLNAQTLEIDIRGGAQGGIPVAIVPFGNVAASPENVSDIISANLIRSGRFEVTPKSGLLSQPSSSDQVNVQEWRSLGLNAMAVGSVQQIGNNYEIQYQLVDVAQGQIIDSYRFNASVDKLRRVAHQISDRIYEKLTGIPGAFDTKLAYVLTNGSFKNKTYNLNVSDSDGANEFSIVEKSSKPIISPAWSPDGQQLAYTQIDKGQQRIYLQQIYTGSRQVIAEYKGVNTSPAFSPDGRTMAFVSSRDGDAEIYLMDLASKKITRLTNSRGIDTEPSFSPDGRSIVFTSDRSGRPQVYRMSKYGGQAERLTFQGKQNAKPEYSSRSGNIVLMTNQGNGDQVAILGAGGMKILSRGPVDDSPVYAPNGEMILYATKNGGRGVLSVVSELGLKSYDMTFRSGEVKDPAWSPLLP